VPAPQGLAQLDGGDGEAQGGDGEGEGDDKGGRGGEGLGVVLATLVHSAINTAVFIGTVPCSSAPRSVHAIALILQCALFAVFADL